MPNDDSYRYSATRRRLTGTRWAEDDEIRAGLSPIWLLDKKYEACGLPLISDGRRAWVDHTDSHTLVLGSTGSKKTRLFVMPMMHIIAKAGESVVCTDPKGELYERTSGLFRQEGYDIRVINLRDPIHSHGWNPIRTAQRYFDSGDRERSASLVNDLSASLFPPAPGRNVDPFWQQTSSAMFAGLCGMMVENSRAFPAGVCNFATLRLLSEGLGSSFDDEEHVTNNLLDRYPAMSTAQSNLASMLVSSERTFSNIMVSYQAPMRVFYAQESLVRMLSRPEIDFETLGEGKTALYLILPDEKTTLHPLASLMIKQCYESLIHAAQKAPGKQLPVRVNFLLDEFSNLPAIPDMNAMISAARSRSIRFFLVVQSMHQLRSKYGDDAFTIRGNCNNWVFLASRELDLLRELEALCGVNGQTGESLISVTQLQQLDKETGEALVLCNRNYPYISHLADIDEYPFANLLAAPLPVLPGLDQPVSVRDPKTISRCDIQFDANGSPVGPQYRDPSVPQSDSKDENDPFGDLPELDDDLLKEDVAHMGPIESADKTEAQEPKASRGEVLRQCRGEDVFTVSEPSADDEDDDDGETESFHKQLDELFDRLYKKKCDSSENG